MKRRALPMISFPAGDGAFATFCFSSRVYDSGRIELQGFIRMPYSNRPKEGGGIAVPSRALNAKFTEFPQGRVFQDLKTNVHRRIREAKPYKVPVLGGNSAQVMGTETPNMTPDPTTETQPRGRKPGQVVRAPDVVAIENLEGAISRLLWYIAANPDSALGSRLARCAKAGVQRERAEKGLVLVEQAVALARTQLEAAYAAPQRTEQAAQRPTVSL